MLNFLVETKQEYTTQLVNILTPLVFEGLNSIYAEVVAISIPDNILKNFQCFLQRIPKWNNDIINRETSRIMNNTKSFSWLEDLIKATLKANIVVLTYNPSFKQQIKVDPTLYQNIKIEDFIHKVYIECARELWNNPYLFYHLYPPIELKRNQRDTVMLIKDCIREAIRKLLPVKHILQIYLGEEMEEDILNFEEPISEADQNNISKLIRKDLYNNEKRDLHNNEKKELEYNKYEQTIKNHDQLIKTHEIPVNLKYPEQPIFKNNENTSVIIDTIDDFKNTKTSEVFIPHENIKSEIPKPTEINTVGSKILSIINHKNLNLSDNDTSSEEQQKNLSNDHLESNIKKIIDNDLGESETSINLPIKNEKFHEVFSNSVVEEDITKNTQLPTMNQNKIKFFQNYLNNFN